jgi:hypothetical protein
MNILYLCLGSKGEEGGGWVLDVWTLGSFECDLVYISLVCIYGQHRNLYKLRVSSVCMCAQNGSSRHSKDHITHMSKSTDPTSCCNSRILNLGLINRLGFRMRVCTLLPSSGAADLQRVGVLITQLGFPLYPVRGQG